MKKTLISFCWVLALFCMTARCHAELRAHITPLDNPVMAGEPVAFSLTTVEGTVTNAVWDFGDGKKAIGRLTPSHTYARPGVYKVTVTISDEETATFSMALVRAHTQSTLGIPQVLLDSDMKNEQDDQHYYAYALFSQLDILGINSIHHGGGQEPVNYGEILHINSLAKSSGLPLRRIPLYFRGANQPLTRHDIDQWQEATPIETAASASILAAAIGASPSNPAWILPVGPGTNVASAILQAEALGLDLRDRMKIMWVGGSNEAINQDFNGKNDPWSMVVVCRSGYETWIIPTPVCAQITVDKRTESELYPDSRLGDYLKHIVPDKKNSMYAPACLAVIISLHQDLGWTKSIELSSSDSTYKSYKPKSAHVITQINHKAMKKDLFNTLLGKPRKLY